MADTRQVVCWALERRCPFRTGDDWIVPAKTAAQLADLRTVADAEDDGCNVDGICVTGWTIESDHAGQLHRVPCSGFPIETRLGKFGGMADARKTCGECEANATRAASQQVAGCYGHLDIWPDSEELEQQLWQVIEQRGLEDRLRSAFHVTTPLWYGFWIRSPLRRAQAEFLYELLDAVCDRDDPDEKEIVHFLHALRAAIDWELPLHVVLAPLGHTDLGWYTIFPHCPRCKANAPVGRWQATYSTEPFECSVCGQTFIPNEHHSSERDEFDGEAHSLETQLGQAGYEQFRRRFLLHQGCTEQQVEEIVDVLKNGPLLRSIAQMRKKRNATLLRGRASEKALREAEALPRTISFALSDTTNLELVLVPAGKFMMGSPETEKGHGDDAKPQHRVTIARPFYIGRFPITQEQWQTVTGKNPSHTRGEPDLPVDQVSWLDCQEFCEELCARLRRIFRLPSEAQWEYACRAGTTTAFAFGDVLAPDAANFVPFDRMMTDPCADQKQRPTPVGSYPPNAWGIYDMHGNVNEWCEDVWHPGYAGAPLDGSARLDGEDREAFRVVRGGWCSATELVCRSASRRPLRADAGSRKDDGEEKSPFLARLMARMFTPYGFRVVCELE